MDLGVSMVAAQSMKTSVLFAISISLAAVGCGDDGGTSSTLPDAGNYVALEGEALALTDSSACAIDGDCATGQVCFQSVCAVAEEAVEVVPGLSLADLPSRVQRIKTGQANVSVQLGLSGSAPAELQYRIERSDKPEEVPVVQTAQVEGGSVQIDIPIAGADLEELLFVNIVSAAGTAEFIVAPEFSDAGRYGGEVVMNTFGQVGLPIEFDIVTDPPTASLANADAAYLVLAVDEGNLWNPTDVRSGGPTYVTRELEYDAFVQGWVARFTLPYSLPQTSAFGWVTGGGTNAVSRRMRFELTPIGDGVIVGSVSDRWAGLFETRTTGGVRQSEDVAFEGTFEVQHIDEAPLLAEVPVVNFDVDPVDILPAPALAACATVAFDDAAQVGGFDRDCAGISDRTSFVAADAAAQASCALAMAEVGLSSETTASQIVAFLDDNIPDPGGQSFADFMDDCVSQTDGTCVPSPRVLCSRQLAATALRNGEPSSDDAPFLLEAYLQTSREAFLGRQFAAFHQDAQTRLDWLKASDYPAVVTSAVESFVAGLLEEWQTDVLQTHLEVIRGHLDAAAGNVLGQDLTGFTDAQDQQRLLLLEVTQSWRATADAISLGASRWSTLLTNPSERLRKATYVYDRTLELYVAAGVLAELNRAAGAGANNAVFTGGFRSVLQEVAGLALPFDQLIYERQGEVVVSTSLDPSAGNATILAELEDEAMEEVAAAQSSVNDVIERAQAELLRDAQLTARIANEAAELETTLVDLCGLPDGCSKPDTSSCAPRVQAGECGFVVSSSGNVLDAFPDEANPSEAGAAILEIQAALLEMRRAEQALISHVRQTDLYYETTAAFAEQVNGWNAERLALVAMIDSQIGQLQSSSDATLAALADNTAAQLERRQTRIEEQQDFVDNWEKISEDGIESDLKTRRLISLQRGIARGLKATAEFIDKKAKAVKEGLPKSTGMSNDITSTQRMAILLSSLYVTKVMKAGAIAAEANASRMESKLRRTEQLREAELQILEFTDEVRAVAAEADVEVLRNQFALLQTATASEQRIAAEVIENMERDVEAALAYERDLVELRDRRDEVMARLIENDELDIQVEQASLAVEQAVNNYSRIVQRAQLVSARLVSVRNQLDNVNRIVGSPSAVFAWANRLTVAESRLERAKSALMDWVVALEYFAVRPFFDSRIQILLARNTAQLEEIAEDLERIQDSCGGAVNAQTVEVSVRDDLLGITRPIENFETGETLAPAQRFHAILEEARIPVDRRVRYRSDATVGDLLNRSGILATSFDIGMNEFANLATTCNAKISEVAVELVGENLGSALPTVSLLYDGTSRLRSCQPNIEALVSLIGPTATPFAEVTEFQTPGRSVSPVAGINEFPVDSNTTLGGLPLSSQYTVLIDPLAGENRDVDWSALEDVRLRIKYTYQDLFPLGQCQ